jgi:hypothetical protein
VKGPLRGLKNFNTTLKAHNMLLKADSEVFTTAIEGVLYVLLVAVKSRLAEA